MTTTDYQNGKIVTLSRAFDNRAKVLNIFYFAAFAFRALPLFYLLIRQQPGLIPIIVISIIAGVFVFAAYRFLNKAVETEKLFINPERLTLIKSGVLSQKNRFYEVNLISRFRHLDKPETTKHPLAGESFDYLGFQTEQQVINEMHGDSRLAFDYEGKTIKFGENIYSWDFEQLVLLIDEITGKDVTRDSKDSMNVIN